MSYDTDRDSLVAALCRTAYLHGDFLLRSGVRSSVYFDKYLAETDPALLGPIGRAMAALLPAEFDILAGQELGGIPLATAIALETGRPFVLVRKHAKEHGTGKAIEGPNVAGQRAVIIEDVLTSGGAALEGARSLQAAGATVVTIVALLDRQEGAMDAISAAGLSAVALLTRAELDRYL